LPIKINKVAKKMNFIYSAKIKKLFFVDVIEILTDSVNPTVYWRKLKQRLREE